MSFIRKVSYLITFQALLLLPSGQSVAQESMMADFSYLYMEKLIAIAKENYPRTQIYEKRVKIADQNVNVAKASWLEPISLMYMDRTNFMDFNVQGVNSNMLIQRGFFLTVNLSPVSLFLRKPFEIKRAKEEVLIAAAERDEYSIQLEAEVKKRYINYLQLHNALKLISKKVVDAEATYTYMKSRYERSEISFNDFNEASSFLTTTQTDKISTEANYLNAKFSLEELLTIKLEDIK